MDFNDAFTELLGNEGNYSNNINDSGGETMYGITKRVAVGNGYTGQMVDLPLGLAKQIAKSQYWDKYHCDELPYIIGFQVFDAAYNGGYPVKWLQQASGVRVDGIIGPGTVRAVLAEDPDKIVMRFDAYRLKYLTAINTWPSFGKGWVNRIANNLLSAAK